jgi:hypothetical protein
MAKASVLTIRVPAELKERIENVADEQGVSINQLAMYMFAREVTSMEAGEKISKYWTGYDREEILSAFDTVMRKVKRRRVPAWDRVKP